jgi:hypothetical protein
MRQETVSPSWREIKRRMKAVVAQRSRHIRGYLGKELIRCDSLDVKIEGGAILR